MSSDTSTSGFISLAGYILLNQMIEQNMIYDTFLQNDDNYLEPVLTDLMAHNFVQIVGSTYQVTRKGREEYEKWMKRYYEWIPRLEVFSAVDLTAGEFAFTRYYDFNHDQAWEDYLNQSRFQDVRIAVCEHQGLDSKEIVFMNFLNKGRWKDLEKSSGWQFDLGTGKILEEVKEIVQNAIKIKDLGYEDQGNFVSGENVIEDIIRQGEELTLKLWEEEKKRKTSQNNNQLEKEVGLDDAYKL